MDDDIGTGIRSATKPPSRNIRPRLGEAGVCLKVIDDRHNVTDEEQTARSSPKALRRILHDLPSLSWC
jgi:hypothetical protein